MKASSGATSVVIWLNCLTFLWMQTWAQVAAADAFEEGLAAGRGAVPVERGAVSSGSAASVVPGYTAHPPQTRYKGQTGLGAKASAQLAACAATPDDVSCQAQTTAMTSANTPRPAVGPYDPAVQAARNIAANPSLVMGSVSAYYAGCTTADVGAASSTTKVCNRYTGLGTYACRRDLTVEVTREQSCAPGTWYVSDVFHRPGYERWADQMIVQALCEPDRHDGKMQFRANAFGSDGGCTGWVGFEIDMSTPTSDAGLTNRVATLLPDWSPGGCGPALDVYQVGPGCVGDNCTKTFHYVRSVANHTRIIEEHWRTLTFARAGLIAKESPDAWINNCPVLASGGRCTAVAGERCVDGPGVKMVNGHAVSRACWAYETTFNCEGGAANDECAPLAASGCTPQISICKQTDPLTHACLAFQDTYSCPQPASTVTTASNCPTAKFCLGTNCFDTASVADPDFARSMSMLEGAREAGVYLNTNMMTVFNGEDNRCRNRLLTNCCKSDASGKGMTNQSVFGAGSALVYDVLMNSEDREFLMQGLQALFTSAGFGSGSFTSYGVTMAVNGTALPAGSTVLYAGDQVVIAVDPWSLAIAMIIYVVMSFMSCNADEAKLALKNGASLCHYVGNYCSRRVLGACIEHRESNCCFNSVLARIVNEQGRSQIGKGWGGAKTPDCSGFTIAQLQSLDFARMDFSEFYASISPKLLNPAAAGASNAARISTCYYGQGRC
jgi:conjugal transfer mating pair stabilization protein TraN